MFFRKFPRFSGYSRPSSSTIRSALWENAHRSLAGLGVLSNRWRRFAANFCSVLFSAMASRGPTSENSDMENANKPASSWPLKQGPKKWSKHGCDKGTLTVVLVSRPVVFAFCGRLLVQQHAGVDYFDPARDWPQPIEFHATFSILLEELAFLGDTRSRCELLVFAQANPARLPLTMGILQPDIPVRRMTSERRTKLTDALVRVLRRFLTPIGVALPGAHDGYMRDSLLALAGHGDGHVLTVAVALLLAILTGRSDLCIAGVFGAGKTRSLAVLLIALSCELDDFYAIVYTKENVAAKALADQISDLSPPTQSTFGRLLGRIEEGKGEAYATKIDVRCSDRNRVIAEKAYSDCDWRISYCGNGHEIFIIQPMAFQGVASVYG